MCVIDDRVSRVNAKGVNGKRVLLRAARHYPMSLLYLNLLDLLSLLRFLSFVYLSYMLFLLQLALAYFSSAYVSLL